MFKGLVELIVSRDESVLINGVPLIFTGYDEMIIEEEINNHTSLVLRGESLFNKDVRVGQEISVTAVGNINNALIKRRDLLFTGVIEKVETIESFITIEAKSFSIELDRKKRKRSFQDINKKYSDMLKVIQEEGKYDKFHFILPEKNDRIVENLLVQYDETDWEFLKRIVSHFNEAIIIENGKSTEEKQSVKGEKKWTIWAGFVAEATKALDPTNYKITGSVNLKDNYIIASTKLKYEIGNLISDNSKIYIIIKSKLTLINNIITYEYKMVEKEKLNLYKQNNSNIAGKSVLAEVVEVGTKENLTRVRVDFVFDNEEGNVESQEKGYTRSGDKKYWFKFATPYSGSDSGIYFMPEIKDKLLINFINGHEDNGFAGESLRDGNKYNDKSPEVVHKRIKISTGQQILLSKELEKVRIIGNEDRTVFADFVKDYIKFSAEGSSATLKKDSISLTVGDSSIIMTKEGIELKAGSSSIKLSKGGKIEVVGS